MPLIDRNRLRDCLEVDLQAELAARAAYGPVPPWFAFKTSEQLRNINRKANDSGVTMDLERDAFRKFTQIQGELRRLELDEDSDVFIAARHLVHKWLPPLETVWGDIWSHCSFGPGTIFHAKSPHQRTIHHKIGGSQTVSPRAHGLAVQIIGEYYPRFAEQIRDVKIVRGNRLAFVPKDEGRCRLIAVEPSLNIFLQLGVGKYLMNLMKYMGVADLEQGQQLHRDLVRDYNTWGTIDLSDASDRISRQVVKGLLPRDWFELLDALRSSHTTYDGEWIEYSSFSSQGNAFTFPLETLIFKSIAMAASQRRCHVYGDDIIAPVGSCSSIASALESFGFVVNTQKSFWGQHEGLLADFRESCGEDTLRGFPVRSVFYKDPATDASLVAGLANQLYAKWGILPTTHRYLLSLIPDPLVGPSSYATSEGGEIKNRVGTEFTSWLWWEIASYFGIDLPEAKYSRHIQCRIFRLRYWSRKQLDIPRRHRLGETVEWLAFLYSGSPYASALDRAVVRRKVVPQFLN